jgi:hypothetical protein
MTTNESCRRGRHSLHDGMHHTREIGETRIGLRLIPCNLPLGVRRVLKRLIIRLALAGILSPQIATRLLTQLGLVSA